VNLYVYCVSYVFMMCLSTWLTHSFYSILDAMMSFKNTQVYCLCYLEPGSSVVSGYRLDDRVIEVQSPAEAKGFFL
jgi:hypothetical protein